MNGLLWIEFFLGGLVLPFIIFPICEFLKQLEVHVFFAEGKDCNVNLTLLAGMFLITTLSWVKMTSSSQLEANT
jgi:hypothetical protein